MSIVFSEKTRRTRLALRWPFSRQITLSVGTLLLLLAVWWAVAAQQWVSPLFLPPPGQVLQKLITIAGPQGFMDATLWQHLAASLTRLFRATDPSEMVYRSPAKAQRAASREKAFMPIFAHPDARQYSAGSDWPSGR